MTQKSSAKDGKVLANEPAQHPKSSSSLAQFKSLIGHDPLGSCLVQTRIPLTADRYKHFAVDSADESVRGEMDEREREIYDLLVELEAKDWDGVSGLEDFQSLYGRTELKH